MMVEELQFRQMLVQIGHVACKQPRDHILVCSHPFQHFVAGEILRWELLLHKGIKQEESFALEAYMKQGTGTRCSNATVKMLRRSKRIAVLDMHQSSQTKALYKSYDFKGKHI